MGTSRTSNKDILDAILGLTEAIKGTQVQEQAPVQVTPAQVATPTPEAPAESPSNIEIASGYREHVMAKVQAKTNDDGEDRILYARRNLSGEVKLAYCLASRWTGLKDNGLIGALAHIKPE